MCEKRSLIVYSGQINEEGVDAVVKGVVENRDAESEETNASLLLTTVGGDSHQAYRLVTILRLFYSAVDVVVFARCKSAGTLVAVGASSVAMYTTGELGPLDVQIQKPDEIAQRSSGLETTNSLEVLCKEAFKAFEDYMLQLIRRSYSSISTAAACRIASDLVSGIFGPIAAQIDPYKVAAVSRSLAIADAYGRRLSQMTNNLQEGALNQLVRGYPDHAFIINRMEARRLFKRVRDPSEVELNKYLKANSEEHTDAAANPPYTEVEVIAPTKTVVSDKGVKPNDEDENNNSGNTDDGAEHEADGGSDSPDSQPATV